MTIEGMYASLLKKIRDIQASGGGVSDYGDLSNKPKINGVILNGNKTPGELELVSYSAQERLIGRWIDNSLLYEKTVDFGALPDATAKNVSHGISNAGVIWLYDGHVTDGSNFYELNYPTSVNNTPNLLNPYEWKTSVSKTNVTIETASNKSSLSAVAVLRYTKSQN